MFVAPGSLPAFGGSAEDESAGAAVYERPTAPDPDASQDVSNSGSDPLQDRYNELELAWQSSLAKPKNTQRLETFQRLMAGFLNEAVNVYPESPWTLRGVEIYGEWCLEAADKKSRRERNHQAALRMLTTARDYFEMIGAEPGQDLLDAIAKMERKAN